MAYEPGELKANFSAVANYELSEKLLPHLQLARVEQVLDALAGSGKEKLFLNDITKHMGGEPDEESRAVLAVLQGNHPLGFQLTVVEADHEGETVFLPVIEDSERKKLLVFSPVAAGERDRPEQVQFISGADSNSFSQVNRFFEDGLRHRRKGSGKEIRMNKVVEMIAGAVASIAGGSCLPDPQEVSVSSPEFIGRMLAALSRSGKDMVAFSVAAQRFEDGSLAQKLDPVVFRQGAEEAFTVNNSRIALTRGRAR